MGFLTNFLPGSGPNRSVPRFQCVSLSSVNNVMYSYLICVFFMFLLATAKFLDEIERLNMRENENARRSKIQG